MNRLIQATFRSRAREWAAPTDPRRRKTEKPMGRFAILYGDKVINSKNGPCYDVRPKEGNARYVANGEIGIVLGQYKGQKWPFGNRLPWKLEVEFSSQPGLMHGYRQSDFGEEGQDTLELAYALTIHKAQGCEFGKTFVIIPNPCRLLTPELVYTALTRQRENVIVFHQGDVGEILK